jgi:DNA-binding MarR family transcriptional regulator
MAQTNKGTRQRVMKSSWSWDALAAIYLMGHAIAIVITLRTESVREVTVLTKRIRHPLAVDALKKFRVIYGCVRQHFRQVEQICGVSGSQLWILQEVATTPGVGVSELAERLSIHQSTCSQLAEKLVARGLVRKERSKEDQRRVGLTLSPQAKKLVASAPGPAEGVFPDALKALEEGELVELNRALSNVIEQLRVRDEKFAHKPLADL